MVLLDLGKNIHAAIQKLASRRTVDAKVISNVDFEKIIYGLGAG